jgi:hypothetical protein
MKADDHSHQRPEPKSGKTLVGAHYNARTEAIE